MNVVFNTGAIAGAAAAKRSASYSSYRPASTPPEPLQPITEKVMRAAYDLLQRGFEIRVTPEMDGSIAIRLYKDGFGIYRSISSAELKYCRMGIEDHIVYILTRLVARYEHDRNMSRGDMLDEQQSVFL